MRLVWTLARIVLALLALAVTSLTVFWEVGPNGSTVHVMGAAIDAVAVVVLVASLTSLWRGRRRLA